MMNRAEEEIESVFARIGEVQQVSLDLEMLTGHVNYIIIIVIVVYIPALSKGCLAWFRFRVSIHHPLGFKGTQPL